LIVNFLQLITIWCLIFQPRKLIGYILDSID